jgi:hypothetical protein
MKELSPFRRWLSCGLQAALLIFPMAVSSSESVWPLEGGKYLVSGGANSVVIFDPSTVEYADEFVGHDSLMRYCTTDECGFEVVFRNLTNCLTRQNKAVAVAMRSYVNDAPPTPLDTDLGWKSWAQQPSKFSMEALLCESRKAGELDTEALLARHQSELEAGDVSCNLFSPWELMDLDLDPDDPSVSILTPTKIGELCVGSDE